VAPPRHGGQLRVTYDTKTTGRQGRCRCRHAREMLATIVMWRNGDVYTTRCDNAWARGSPVFNHVRRYCFGTPSMEPLALTLLICNHFNLLPEHGKIVN
jgi:hypothetical protein